MNYGPLEFADYLRKTDDRAESPIVRAARAARPGIAEPVNLLEAPAEKKAEKKAEKPEATTVLDDQSAFSLISSRHST